MLGYVRRDCPRRMLVTVDDEVGKDALYKTAMICDDNACMMTTRVSSRRVFRDMASNNIEYELACAYDQEYFVGQVIFSTTLLIFDNAVSRSVF